MTWRHLIEIDLAKLRANVECVRKLAEHQELIAVVKADAYGLGLDRCATVYADIGVSILAVAAVSEAQRIRNLLPDQRILILGALLPHEHNEFIDVDAEILISSADEIDIMSALAEKKHAPIAVHLGIDTGMGRNGCLPQNAQTCIERICENQHLQLAGICTHYPAATDTTFRHIQDAIFESIITSCDQQLPIDCLIHRANSEGLLLGTAGPCNAVRIGLLLTGVNPIPEKDCDINLQEVLRWSSAVALCKTLPEQHSVSYRRSFKFQKESRIAIIPVGYADGLPMSLGNGGTVLIHQRPCPIVGQVTMDYIVVDISALDDEVTIGDEVVFIGNQGTATQSLRDFAQQADTIPYTILCGLRGRGQFVYINE